MDTAAIGSLMSTSSLFEGLVPEQFTWHERAYENGMLADDHPEGVPCVGLIARGAVDVLSVSPDGKEVLLNTLRQGDVFGICNLAAEGEMTTLLRCSGKCAILYFSKAEYEALCRRDGQIALRFAACCNRKLQFLLRRIALLTTQTGRGRLISWLLLHADENGVVPLPFTRESLAATLSISRAALYREVALLEERSLLRMERKALVILHREGLEALLYREN